MAVPASVMAALYALLGGYCAYRLDSTLAWAVMVAGTIIAVWRVVKQHEYRGLERDARGSAERLEQWERHYALISLLFSICLGTLASLSFIDGDRTTQLVGMGLLFGYASGVVSRSSIRPRIAIGSVFVATAPVVATVLLVGAENLPIALLLATFALASFDSSRHVYRAAVSEVMLREQLAGIAVVDQLTGLSNRFGLKQNFADFVDKAPRGSLFAVHCLDLDRFKPVNDTYGHPVGDELLKRLAADLRDAVAGGGFAARIGGDEFVIVQGPVLHDDEAEAMAGDCVRRLSTAHEIGEHRVQVGSSLGYVIGKVGSHDLDASIAAADAALYRVKRAGGGYSRGRAPARRKRRMMRGGDAVDSNPARF